MSNIMEVIGAMGKELDGLGNKLDVATSNGSIGAFLSGFIVTPRIVVSESLRDSEELNSIIDFNLNVFSLMYSRVFDILLSVYGYDSKMAIRTLGNGSTFSLEDLSTLGDEPDLDECAKNCKFPLDISQPAVESSLSSKVVKEIELSSSVHHPKTGKEMSIKIKMLMRASISYTDPKEIYTAVDTQGKKVSFSYRWDEYRSGAISLYNLITANDLRKEYKKNRLKERSDFMKYIEERRGKNIKSIVMKQSVNMSKMFQMLIVSKRDLNAIQKLVGGKMTKDRIKDSVLDSILSMSLTSVDDDHETIDLFLADIPGNTEMTFKSLAKGDTNNNNNEIIKWMMGQR